MTDEETDILRQHIVHAMHTRRAVKTKTAWILFAVHLFALYCTESTLLATERNMLIAGIFAGCYCYSK